jgi:hypothetical protein
MHQRPMCRCCTEHHTSTLYVLGCFTWFILSFLQSYLLVGGFSASDYLFGKLKEYFAEEQLKLYRPDGHA